MHNLPLSHNPTKSLFSSFTYEDEVPVGYLTYFLDDANARFLTNAPTTMKTLSDASGWLYFFPAGAPFTESFEVETFDSSGNSIGTWRIENQLSFTDTGEFMGRVAAHPSSLNNVDCCLSDN